MDYYQIISAVLVIVTIVFGSQWIVARKKIGQASKLLTDFLVATQDNVLTPEEGELLMADLLALFGQEEIASKAKRKILAKIKR